ncbi:MAG: PilT/PilU family type 4a pilus ATPase [Solirubrobacteraceae bacterium]
MPFVLDGALGAAVDAGASDVHLKVGARPRARVDGELTDLADLPTFTSDDAAAVSAAVLTTDGKREDLAAHGAADLSYSTADARFRVSAFALRGQNSFVFRIVPSAPDASGLGIPEVVLSWASAPRGLIVVTGPSGMGKSTTCAALINGVNRTRDCHIVTIEDPVEYLHDDDRALISQREIGVDAPTYQDGLRAALRQDPDVILVGEVRDAATADTALRAAETGHLVLCTMHTSDAPDTVQRFLALFSDQAAELARRTLASALVGVVSQRLVPARDGGRALAAEVLVNTTRIADLIGQAAPGSDISSAIAEGDYYGMRTFDQSLLELVRAGEVEAERASEFASSPHDFRLMLGGSGPQRLGEPAYVRA